MPQATEQHRDHQIAADKSEVTVIATKRHVEMSLAATLKDLCAIERQ